MIRSAVKTLAIVFAAFSLLVLGLFSWLNIADAPSRDEVASAESPDGSVIAKLIEVNAGATTSFLYIVTLAGQPSSTDATEVARLYGAVRNASAYGANLRWTGPKELAVEYLDAKSAEVLHSRIVVSNAEVTVALRPNVIDNMAPAGGMQYNLAGRR